ncbi:hypothetical protein MBLNU457_6306t2 [Dothideomycetes sp. NU457]
MAAADQALGYLLQLPPLSLSALLLYGSVARLSHGRFSSRGFYRYQTERMANDKSIAARVVPIIDAFLGLCLLYPGDVRRWASIFVLLGMMVGVASRLRRGGDATTDVLLVGWALANCVFVWLFPFFGAYGHRTYEVPQPPH